MAAGAHACYISSTTESAEFYQTAVVLLFFISHSLIRYESSRGRKINETKPNREHGRRRKTEMSTLSIPPVFLSEAYSIMRTIRYQRKTVSVPTAAAAVRVYLKKNLNASRSSEHLPVRGERC